MILHFQFPTVKIQYTDIKLLFKSTGFCYDIDLFTVIFTRTAFKNLFNQDNHFFFAMSGLHRLMQGYFAIYNVL